MKLISTNGGRYSDTAIDLQYKMLLYDHWVNDRNLSARRLRGKDFSVSIATNNYSCFEACRKVAVWSTSDGNVFEHKHRSFEWFVQFCCIRRNTSYKLVEMPHPKEELNFKCNSFEPLAPLWRPLILASLQNQMSISHYRLSSIKLYVSGFSLVGFWIQSFPSPLAGSVYLLELQPLCQSELESTIF